MKTKILSAILLTLFFLCNTTVKAQTTNTFPSTGSAGIGTTTPDVSSLLEVKSTKKGLLIPRMTKNQRDAIATPATGLLIYQTNSTPGFYYYNGSAWVAVTQKSKEWSLTGNSGTNPSTNFIGTADAHPLAFRVNNIKAGWIDYTGKNNTSFGYQTLLSNTTGAFNTALGSAALYTNTTGGDNTAIGVNALLSNINANDNTAIGNYSLESNTYGYNNTATGSLSLVSNTSGNNNAANGFSALYSNKTGINNTATGSLSLVSNTTGNNNVANGFNALYSNKTGYSNTATGSFSLVYNDSGNNNVTTGFNALYSNTSGYKNTATGAFALQNNTTGNNNVANGLNALYSNTTGYSNVAIGTGALFMNTSLSNLVAIGDSALYNNTIVNGYDGYANTAIGSKALFSNTAGSENTAIGHQALLNNAEGSLNTAIGTRALNYANGSYNTAIGARSGIYPDGIIFDATAIGANAVADASFKVRIGDDAVTSIGGIVGWSNFSDGRYKKDIKHDVQGLTFINSLQPITYTIDINGLNEYYDKGRKQDYSNEKMKAAMKESADKAAKIIYNGFIAQDVEKAAAKLDYNFSGVDKPQTKDGLYGLRYADFVVPLVKAVQELSKMNDAKDSVIQIQNSKIDDLASRLTKIESILNASSTVNDKQSVNISSVSLQQNIPNPFTKTTNIGYSLPQTYYSAKIIITNKDGKALKELNLSAKGKGSLNVDASTLASGAYQYSLLVDGKLIDTKQMVLAK